MKTRATSVRSIAPIRPWARAWSARRPAASAVSSRVKEWINGKSLDQAVQIRNTHSAEGLALPPVKIHCSILAEDAIKAAIADFRAKRGSEAGSGTAVAPVAHRDAVKAAA
jgi:hypothetical protein